MAGFFKSLFGERGGADGPAPARPGPPAATAEHKGFTIRAEPYKVAGGQFQVAGTIVKGAADGTTREYRFIRADVLGTQDLAADMTLARGG